MHIDSTQVDCQRQAMASRQKSVAISIRVTEEVKKAAEKAADDDTRSVTSYVEKLILDDLKTKGYLKK
jgi:predicted HicB family RNase H-like nuclease